MDAPRAGRPGIEKWEGAWIAGLMLAAFLVRWAPTFYPHFWFDEIFTIALSQKSFGEILRLTAADMHPPLYYDWVKFMAMIGNALGGPFATLAWLRLASVGPGMIVCALGWLIARRYWGRRQALWTLAAFAAAPAMTYYSVELRSYSTQHALLLGALYGFLRATEPHPGARRGWLALLGACALAAFYTHSLTTLHLGVGYGLLFLAELGRSRGARRRELAWGAAALAAALAACCAPWLWLMVGQTGALNEERWFDWADWNDLRSTLFWYMPLGPLNRNIIPRDGRLAVMLIFALALVALIANALRHRRRTAAAADATMPHARLWDDRLLIYASVLALMPVLAAFFLSYYRIAKVFLGFRYNLIPAPFITLTLMGLIFRVGERRRRAAALGLLFAITAGASGVLIWQRLGECDIVRQAAETKPEILHPESQLAWNNPTVLPWLGKGRGAKKIVSLDDIVDGKARLDGQKTLYVMTHQALDENYCGLLHRPSHLMRELMKRRGIPQERIGIGAWEAAWRLRPEDLPPLMAELKAVRARIEARRHAIHSGKTLLADENMFTIHGWGPLQYGPDMMPERWTLGPRQHLTWTGPGKSGLYRLRLRFRRPHPFPEETVTVRYRLPGERQWRTRQAGPGEVCIEDKLKVRRPGERLRIHLETVTWRPYQYFEGDLNELNPEGVGNHMKDRHLGMLFHALEMEPESSPGKDDVAMTASQSQPRP